MGACRFSGSALATRPVGIWQQSSRAIGSRTHVVSRRQQGGAARGQGGAAARRGLAVASLVVASSSVAFAQGTSAPAPGSGAAATPQAASALSAPVAPPAPSVAPPAPSVAPAAGSGTGEVPAPAKPQVTPPKLIYFVEAAAPAEWKAAGAAATPVDVTLKVLVQKDGSVGAAEILKSGGEAFDAAAQSAVLGFVFTPAVRNGELVATYIAYTYRFEPPEPAGNEPAPAPIAAPLSGNLEGRVLMLGGDLPLAGARVVVQPTVGEPVETTTDSEGNWVVRDLLPGEYRVSVSSEGFTPIESDETVVLGKATEVVYRASADDGGVEIIVQGQRPPREVTRRTLERREIAKIPGTGGDALRSIQSLPGVARPPGLAGILIVRGAAPEDTNYFVDGALVPLIYHFGGLSSVIPTELLERIDFYPGNFSSRYGRVMGGVVDVALRSPDTECRPGGIGFGKRCFHGLAQVDLIDGRLMLQGPIGKDWSFAIAGRRSWVDAWLKPVLEQSGAGVTSAPVYYDYQAIVEHKPRSGRKLRAQFYGSDDSVKILINNPSAQDPALGGSLRFSTAFYRGQLTYEQQLTQYWDLYATVAVGRDKINFGIGPLLFDLDSYPVEARSELSFKPMRGIKIHGGMDWLAGGFDVHVRAPEPPRDGEPSPGPFTTRPIFDTKSSGTFYRPGWYLEGELQPHADLLVVPGIRLDYARDSGHADVSPRLNARYVLFGGQGDGSRKTTLKGGVGYYYQPPQFQETDPVFGTTNLKSNRSLHYGFGVEQQLTSHIDLSVEGYLKPLTQLVSRSPGQDGFVYNNLGTGRVIGLETLLKYKADARFFGWLAYTLSRSTRKDGPGQEEYTFQYDQTHILTLLGSYRLGGGWELGARFRLVSGNNYTPVNPSLAALYNSDAGAYAPLQGKPFSERFPLFHQLDIRIEKTWRFESWQLQSYLDVWNAYNHQAVEDNLYNFDFSRRAYQTGLPIIPSLGVRGEL